MAGFGSASILVKVAFGLCIGAVLFDIIGFPTPYWTVVSSSNNGLFQSCFGSVCSSIPEASRINSSLFQICFSDGCKSNSKAFKPDALKATAAMVILGFLLGLACLVLTICYIFVESLGTKVIKIVCMVLAFAAALFTLVGVIIFAKDFNTNLGWSFFMVIIGGVIHIATGVIFIIDTVKG